MQNAGGEQGEEARKMMEDQVKCRPFCCLKELPVLLTPYAVLTRVENLCRYLGKTVTS
jgi:hypothetical protein